MIEDRIADDLVFCGEEELIPCLPFETKVFLYSFRWNPTPDSVPMYFYSSIAASETELRYYPHNMLAYMWHKALRDVDHAIVRNWYRDMLHIGVRFEGLNAFYPI